MNKRTLLLIVFSIVVFIAFYSPLRELWVLSSDDELYSHIFLIPIISAYFIYLKRRELFQNVSYSFSAGLGVLITGSLFYMTGLSQGFRLTQNDYLSLMTFSAVLTWTGGFILLYGIESVKTNLFPFLFLFFMVPIPGLIVERVIHFLQIASTEVSYGLFNLTGIPILRDGFIFHLPGLSIEVAEQCSGIRSSIALLITSIMAGQLFLKSAGRRIVLALVIIPITILKNGLRIVTLSLLGVYVDQDILSSSLHRKGGIPFFFLSLIFLGAILWLLKRPERKTMNV
ncbi:MAG: exosortase [Nitrospirae bacterium]|nr:exosortase [Nitrospirota bacterium]